MSAVVRSSLGRGRLLVTPKISTLISAICQKWSESEAISDLDTDLVHDGSHVFLRSVWSMVA